MWTDRASSGSSSSSGRMSGRFKHWIWGRFGAASGAANAFQWDQFDTSDDAAAAVDAAAVARCVHGLRPKFYTHSWRKRRSKNGATKRRENPPNPLGFFCDPLALLISQLFFFEFLWIGLKPCAENLRFDILNILRRIWFRFRRIAHYERYLFVNR